MITHIANRKSSGLTVSAYCKQHAIGEALYYYWQKQLNTPVTDAVFSFRQIPVCGNTAPVIISYPNGVCIELGSVPDISVLKQLVCCI